MLEIQAIVEDFMHQISATDNDGYAQKLSTLFFENCLSHNTQEIFVEKARKIKTVFFVQNQNINKNVFLQMLSNKLFSTYKKKVPNIDGSIFADVVKKQTTIKRMSIGSLLEDFRYAIESRGINQFWKSRKDNTLQNHPEEIAQANLAVFTLGVLSNKSYGHVFREFASGIGYVDLGIQFSSTLHLLELKILKNKLIGPNQLAEYMKSEKRKISHLVVFDSRPPQEKTSISNQINVESGIVKIHLIDINPKAPSDLN